MNRYVLRVHNFLAAGCILSIDPLQDIVNDQAFANPAVAVIVLDMIIRLADAIQFVGVAVVMRAVFLADQYDRYIGPSLSKESGTLSQMHMAGRCGRTYSSSNSSTEKK